MRQRIMLSFYGLIIAMAVFSTHAGAVALGKIDVASHLGEPFYAEVPLTLDEGEVISSVSVELAEPDDYRILEVYRDRALQLVRADVESDSRGTRVELTSRSVIDAPFFNLVIKVRYGRATHFKKYPVFLDLPRAAAPSRGAAPLPSVSVDEAAREAAEPTVAAVEAMPAEATAVEEQAAPFRPYDQWARTSHYGPMVYGDTISTVADRLRIDNRYSRNQVMVALFEKNRSKFEKDNINLIQAGTRLDVPMANEVERISSEQANSVMKEHNQRWRELVKQPRYAAVKEAQETRYSKRVRVGKSATGVAAAPVSESESSEAPAAAEQPTTSAVASDGEADGMAAESEVTTALTASVAKLQKENEELQAKLAESSANFAKFSASGVADVQAAADARIKRLELQLARLRAELDSARQSETVGSAFDWLTYALGGLVIVLLGGIGYLMRRERQHPATQAAAEAAAPVDFEEPADATVAEEVPEIDVVPVEEPAGDTGEQMGVDEFEDAFTDSIPDLTADETGEMEAFEEDQEEEPDPNVDYLSEADVYMRYGMEDEAEKQVELALKLSDTDQDAHAKLVQVRKAKGDDAGVDAALSSARMVLSGNSLTDFEATISGMAAGNMGVDVEEESLDDTLPPGALDVSDMESETPFDEVGDQDEGSDADVADAVDEAAADMESAVAEEVDSLELGDIELPEEVSEGDKEAETEATEVAAEASPVEDVAEAIDTDGLDFDLSGLELPDEATSEPEAEADEVVEEQPEEKPEEQPEEAAAVVEEESEFEPAESVDDDNGLGLDLSDFDLPSEMMEASEEGSLQVDALDELGTADLDKTVVMDWSKETLASVGQNVGGESGADEISFSDDEPAVEASSAEESPVEEPVVEEAQTESEPEEHLSSIELTVDDLNIDVDVNFDESTDSDEPDDFSSTIQTSIEKIQEEADSSSGAASDEEKSDADESLEFEFEPADEEKAEASEGEISAEGLGEVSADDLSGSGSLEDLLENSDENFDATMELDSLLSELGEDETASDKKKDSDKEA